MPNDAIQKAWGVLKNALTTRCETGTLYGKCSTLCINIVEAIAALRSYQPENAWRPIETAPKDGTRIDLWVVEKNGYRAVDVEWVAGTLDIDGFWQDLEGFIYDKRDVTHWKPLPHAPQEQK